MLTRLLRLYQGSPKDVIQLDTQFDEDHWEAVEETSGSSWRKVREVSFVYSRSKRTSTHSARSCQAASKDAGKRRQSTSLCRMIRKISSVSIRMNLLDGNAASTENDLCGLDHWFGAA